MVCRTISVNRFIVLLFGAESFQRIPRRLLCQRLDALFPTHARATGLRVFVYAARGDVVSCDRRGPVRSWRSVVEMVQLYTYHPTRIAS
jgi:hypothetical protein